MVTSDQMIPYFYAVPQVVIAAQNGTATQTLTLDTASDFLLYCFISNTTQDGTAFAPNYYTCYVKNNTTGLDITAGFIQQATFAPPASLALEEKIPIRFPRQTQLLFNFTNLYTGSLTINLVLKGYKIYKNPTAQ